MIRNYLVVHGKVLGRLIVAAVSAGLLMSGGMADRSVFAEEDTIVSDDSEPEEPAIQEETTAAVVDPSFIDGLFEVAGETSDSKGASGSEQSSDEKKSKKDEKKLIVGYKQVGVQASIHFEMGEKPSLDSLQRQFPSQLDVYFLGEKKAQTLPVTWECYSDDYSNTNLNYYFFTPKFDESKYTVKGLDLQSESPYIEVVQDALTYEMIDSAPPKENEAAVFQYCTEKLGLNTAAACGILANIYCESGFRTNAIGDGGTSVGICQWHNGRWTNLKNYAPDDWQTLEGQLRFMKKELRTGYSGTLNYIRNVSDDEQGAYDAAYYWCMHYEMPDKIISRSTTRGYLAKNVYWKRYGLGEDETEAEFGLNEDETEAETDLGKDETEAETDLGKDETEAETDRDQGQSKADPGKGKTEEETDTSKEETKAKADISKVETKVRADLSKNETEVRIGLDQDESKAYLNDAKEEMIIGSADAETKTSKADDEKKFTLSSVDTDMEADAEEDVVDDAAIIGPADSVTEVSAEDNNEGSVIGSGEAVKAASDPDDSADGEDIGSLDQTVDMDESYAGIYRCISSDGLNIRKEQSTDADVAGFIPPDDKVTVLAGDGEWAKVKYGETEGYSMLEFLEKIEDQDESVDESEAESVDETVNESVAESANGSVAESANESVSVRQSETESSKLADKP